MNKGRIAIQYMEKDKRIQANLMITNGEAFLIQGLIVKKITDKGLKESSAEELEKAMSETNNKTQTKSHIFKILEKELGDFEIIL